MPRLLIYCTEASGGLADYAHAQAEAIASFGIAVTLLAPENFIHHSGVYSLQPDLRAAETERTSRVLHRLVFFTRLLAHARCLDATIRRSGHCVVLWTSYSEYLAPLWAWRFRRLRRLGVHFAAIVHDPVRNYQVGPRWWHRLSIAEGYSFLEQAFVHAPLALDTVRPMPALWVTVIPHGAFPFPPSSLSRVEARLQLGVPPAVPLLLCFGRLRTDKNLAHVLQALAGHPTAHLLVAGPEATPGQWQSHDYRRLARDLGVESRCHWQIRFHTPQQVADVFQAADAVVLAYAASFRSASGVLNVVANYRLPVVASAGDSALLSAVQRYGLGLVIPADDTAALAAAITSVLASPPEPDWQSYLEANSWSANACQVVTAMGLSSGPP